MNLTTELPYHSASGKASEVTRPENVLDGFQGSTPDAAKGNSVPQNSPRLLTHPSSKLDFGTFCQ